MKLKVGITGQNGFIGYHVIQYLHLQPEEFEVVPFERNFFDDSKKLQEFVKKCDAIIHLAAMNRGDEQDIYQTNVSLVQKLISAMESAAVTPPDSLFFINTGNKRKPLWQLQKRGGSPLCRMGK